MTFSKLLLLIPILLLSACATTDGTRFQKIADIPKDKGVVYIYRPNAMAGLISHYRVFDGNDEEICSLRRGGYCLLYAKPGEVQLWGQNDLGKGLITLDVKSGQEHFIKGGISAIKGAGLAPAAFGAPDFTLVNNKTGQDEISDCLLIKTAETSWTIGNDSDAPNHSPIPFSLSEIPQDKAVVCFYRVIEKSIWKMGSGDRPVHISEKKQDIDKLVDGSLVCYATTPGSHVYKLLWPQINQIRSTKVNLMQGIISYLRAEMSVYEGWQLAIVPETEALKEIRDMKNAK
jgi:hypothetical protein